MISFPLNLAYHDRPRRPVAAWFIPGDDPQRWLEEIVRWAVPQEQLLLYVLPRSRTNNAVAGVLVTLPAKKEFSGHPRGLAFGLVAEKLYLPVQAELSPPVAPAELKLLCEINVFHPACGLIGFEASAALRLCDLIFQPPSCVENWNFARPGIFLPGCLTGIELHAPLALRELFGDAGAQIATNTAQNLPPGPDEPRDGRGADIARAINRHLAAMMKRLMKLVPRTARRRTWLNDVEEWAARKLQNVYKDMDFLRNKELHRLMRMLEDDPEQGLRHAIPMNSFGHRGMAPPGATLGERDINFNFGALGGGQAADFWNLTEDFRRKLRAKYLEMADREMKLGRFRRAAYIHAELLGHLHAAALVLKQGRHFREAALIYRDHLKRSREAAACFREGGLFGEAIAIYEKEKCFVELAELHLALGQRDQAGQAYRAAIAELVASHDRVGAAKLLEVRLNSPEEALAVLAAGWPAGPQATLCLREEFSLLGRMGAHQKAIERIHHLRRETPPAGRVTQAPEVLAEIHESYPDQAIRHSAADTARVLVSRQLGLATKTEARALIQSLTSLARQDRLLARDGNKFLSERKERKPPREKQPSGDRLKGPVLLKTFHLPAHATWRNARSHNWFFWAAGHVSDGVIVVRGIWDGTVQGLKWRLPDVQTVAQKNRPPLLLELGHANDEAVIVHLPPGGPLSQKNFPVADLFFRKACSAGTPEWFSDRVAAVACAPGKVWILHAEDHGLVLTCHGSKGAMIANHEVPALSFPAEFEVTPEPCLAMMRDHVALAFGREAHIYSESRLVTTLTFEETIVSLAAMPPALYPCLVAALQRGAAIWWNQDAPELIALDLVRPLAAFTKRGALVLLSGSEGRIYDVGRQGVDQIIHFSWPGPEPVALVAGGEGGEFGVVATDGTVSLFVIRD